MRSWFCIIVLMLLVCGVFGQSRKTKNVIIITLDGYRWQELFEGADPKILSDTGYSDHPESVQQYQGTSSAERRKKLMPFFWNVIATQGQLYGNRNFRNKVNCANHHLISYPGYSEMLVGYPTSKVSSNKPRNNPNPTVLEYIHAREPFHHHVAAFATWDVFSYILRKDESKLYVNAGKTMAIGQISKKEAMLNDLQQDGAKRTDQLTFEYAFEYLKRERPRVMFIGFDATDEYSHAGRYDKYLQAAHDADNKIAQLWRWIQSQPDYKDQTTIFITTDHGRGSGKNNWKNHRLFTRGSRHIWFAVLGPDTPALGEMKVREKYFQKQAAKTIAAFLNVPYYTKRPAGDIVHTMLAVPIKSIETLPEHASGQLLRE